MGYHMLQLYPLLLIFIVFLLQMNIPSSFISPFDVAFSDGSRRSPPRSFPENLGSGSTPLTPKVDFHIYVFFHIIC